MSKPKTEYTLTEFAKKHKLGIATVWRWANKKHLTKRFKMYDAEVVEVAGKKFVRLIK